MIVPILENIQMKSETVSLLIIYTALNLIISAATKAYRVENR